MAILDIRTLPDPTLKQVSEPVTGFDDALRAFVDDLEETRRNGPATVGIAAPQVGHFRRIVIIDCSSTRKPVPNHGRLVLVNPEITHWEGYEMGREGCLSVPDYTGNVIRATRIHLVARDPEGQSLEFDMEGYEARAAQHEIDHLDGKLFIDHISKLKREMVVRKFTKMAKQTGKTAASPLVI